MTGMARAALLLAVGLVVASVLATGCKKTTRDTLLPEKDFAAVEKSQAKFDRNNLIDVATFTDVEAVDAVQVQKFFSRTPYDQPSFLETYQSNGTRAADAVLRVARTYRVNPLVLLTFLETEGALLAERNYPLPPERVEYVFRCGCEAPGNCLPALAGIDRQLECLGRELRSSLDAIAANGSTPAGWGPDGTSTTLDGLKVTPANEATAAIYQHIPAIRVGEDKGAWIFWNVWQLYTTTLEYGGPLGNGAGTGKGIGDACTSDGECGSGNLCSTDYPGGYCTKSCTGDCPSSPDRPEAFCAAFPEGGFCFVVCNPGAPACRDGYACSNVKRFGSADGNDAKYVCVPKK